MASNSQGGFEASVESVLREVRKYGVKSVCVTGGEPMLQLEELKKLVGMLKESGFEVVLETNGTLYDKEVFDSVDCVSVDMKPPSSGEKSDERLLRKLSRKDQVKVIVAGKPDYEFAKHIASETDVELILQPTEAANAKKLVSRVLKDRLNVRVIPQLHKIIGLK